MWWIDSATDHEDDLAGRSGLSAARTRVDMMAAQFGLDREALERYPGLVFALAENCAQCHQARQCQSAIAGGKALPDRFCPNADTYRGLMTGFMGVDSGS